MLNYKINKNNRYKIKTKSGYRHFGGINKVENRDDIIKFIFNDNTNITVLSNHRFLCGTSKKGKIFRRACKIKIGNIISNKKVSDKIYMSNIENNSFYDITDVECGNHYITSDVTSHNCDEFSFADPSKVDAFMDSIFPVISASPKNQIIITTTPKGRDTFARLWQESEDGLNDFKRISIKWDRIPGKDEAWKKAEISRVGPELFLQNHEVEFIGSSKTLLSKDGLLKLKRKNPLISDYLYDDVKLYKEYNENSNYIISIDTARTTGKDLKIMTI